MNLRAKLLVLPFLSLLLLTGCWNYRELNNLALALAIGIDKVPDRDTYRYSFQIVNAREIAGGKTGQVVPVVVYSSEGQTLLEAARKASKKVPRRLNVQHVRILIIGEETAKKGIESLFDFMERDAEPRLPTKVFIAKNTDAKSILETLTPIESIPANAILGKSKTSERFLAENFESGIDDVIRGLLIKGGGPVISGVEISGPQNLGSNKSVLERVDVPAQLIVNSLALFKEGRLSGWVNHKDARGISWINKKIHNTIVSLDCEDKKDAIAIEVLSSKIKTEAKFRGGQPVVHIRIRDVSTVGEVICPSIDPSKSEVIRKLEQQVNARIKEEVEGSVRKAQAMKTDVLGFGDAINRTNPKAWKRMEGNWGTLFSTCEFDVHVESKIQRTGKITKPYLYELKKEK
ncbi:spore germination protein KC [Paenibacillus sp. JGP012]|uniref:Ger(x)C family spore germination protein n=1 Tax=Paenibacillus sp. JGP012 TaxID=2735914 RepID=UPI00161F5122|nr:Ger(x)C family spore germination protein [Paenibacillus sp. JGP012]MBB6021712.1 spore germination protein KC [Paenibacillus sp. JGP012]